MPASKYQLQLRKPLQLALIASCLAVTMSALFLWNFYNVDFFNGPTDTVWVKLSGLSPDEQTRLRCAWGKVSMPLTKSSVSLPCAGARYDQTKQSWIVPSFYFGVLQIKGPDSLLNKVTKIEIKADGVDVKREGAKIWADCVKADTPSLEEPEWTIYSQVLPGHGGVKTSGQILNFFGRAAAHFEFNFVCFVLLLLLFVVLIKLPAFNRLATYILIAPVKKKSFNKAYFAVGLMFTATALLFQEWRHPFFFVRDDNYDQFLPVIEKCAHALIANGVFSTWNPYQFMGAPTISLGVYALTYPPTYIAYAIAEYFLRDSHSTIDVFVCLHLIAGYVITYLLLREQNVRASFCAVAAASFALSGFFLVAGSAWYYVAPVAVFAPLMVLLVDRFLKKRSVSLGWTVAMALTVGIFFHAGNAQMWFYTLVTCSLGVITAILFGATSLRLVASTVPALLIGIGIAAPLLMVQMDETAYSIRSSAPGFFSGLTWSNLLLPVGNLFPGELDSYPIRTSEELYYFGGVFVVFTLAASWYVMFMPLTRQSGQKVKFFLKRNVWLIPAIFSLLMAAGYSGFIWNVFRFLPIFSKFTQSDKFLVFAALYCVVTASVIIERGLKLTSRLTEISLCLAISALLCVHVYVCDSSLYNMADKPYPPLPVGERTVLHSADEDTFPHRVMSCSPDRDMHSGFSFSMMLNFPAQYNVFALEGYEPLLALAPDAMSVVSAMDKEPFHTAEEFGVRYLINYRSRPAPSLSRLLDSGTLQQETVCPRYQAWMSDICSKSRAVGNLPNGTIWELPEPKPLVYLLLHPETRLSAVINDRGIKVDISKLNPGAMVIANFRYRSAFIADIDGVSTPLGHDLYKRIIVTLTQKGHWLTIEFRPFWQKGFVLGVFLMALGCGSLLLLRRKNARN